ncbi:MAG TPA: hypothetical protein PKH07_08580, partial [bacterium]|nr:hypothetical protein [bacterium]
QIVAFNIYDEPTLEMARNALILSRAVEDADLRHRPAINVLWNPRTLNRIYQELPPRAVFTDWYPLGANTPVGMYGQLESNIEAWGRTAFARGVPFWMVLQGLNIPSSLRFPTTAECRYMAYLSLANNAQGILYYVYEPSGRGLVRQDFTPRPHYEAIGRMYARLIRHESLLVSLDPSAPLVSCAPPGYTKTFKDDSDQCFAFVVNRDVKTERSIPVSCPASVTQQFIVHDVFRNTVVPHRITSTDQGLLAEFYVGLAPGAGTLLQIQGVGRETLPLSDVPLYDKSEGASVAVAEPCGMTEKETLGRQNTERGVSPAHTIECTNREQLQRTSLPDIPGALAALQFPNVPEVFGFALTAQAAYIAAGESGLISVHLSPLSVVDATTEGKAFDVVLSEDILSIAAGDEGARLYRVLEDSSLERQSVISGSPVFVAAIEDSLMALSSGLDEISFWNVSQPEYPKFVSECSVGGCIHQIVFSNQNAFVALGDDGLVVLDLSKPDKPIERLRIGGSVTRIGFSDHVLLACGSSGLCGFQITEQPFAATKVWSIPQLQYGSISASGNQAVHAAGNLTYLNKVESGTPEITACLGLLSSARSVAGRNGNTFVLGDDMGFRVFDDRSRKAPAAVASKPSTAPRGITTDGTHLFLVDARDGLIILDTAQDGSWRAVGSLKCPYPVDSVSVSGSVAYLSSKTAGFFVADISNPADPQLIGMDTERTGNAVRTMASDNLLFVASQRFGLKIYDRTDPSQPLFLSQLASGFSGNDLTLLGERVYLAAQGDYSTGQGLVAVDVGIPAKPQVLEVSYTVNPLSICTVGELLAVADDAEGVLIFDTNGSSLKLVHRFDDLEAVKVVSHGSWMAILTRTSGWWLARIQQDLRSEIYGAFGLTTEIPLDACFHDERLW